MAIESAVGDNLLLPKVSESANWARKSSLWPLTLSTTFCAIEAQ
jgi:NADH:ubiquinone oxidoreductase subunit B-like Fe-S oxidoreductase